MRYLILVALLASSCPQPTPTPSPSPTPTPVPTTTTTTLVVEKCKFTANDVTSWKHEAKPYAGQQFDFTPIACGDVPPCNNPDPRRAKCCALSIESGNWVCAQELFGDPWVTPDITVALNDKLPGVPVGTYTTKVSRGSGFVSICGSISMNTKPGACVKFAVAAGTPPCTVITNPADGPVGTCKLEADPDATHKK